MNYEEFAIKVKGLCGISLADYKDAQMMRRLTSFYEKKGCKNFKEYYDLIKKEKKELDEFMDKITINVTEFFRNRERWRELVEVMNKEHDSKWEVLSAACSTGEEVYTIKMLAEKEKIDVTINAIDIDKGSLEKAKKGEYEKNQIIKLNKNEIKEFFDENEEGKYSFKEEYKRNIKFERKDMLVEEIKGKYDLIVCRNVMIYFKEEAKEGLYIKFNKILREKGVLYVGSTEQIFKPELYGFEMIRPFFYKKIKNI